MHGLALLLTGMTAGTLTMGTFGLRPAVSKFDPEMAVIVRQRLIGNLRRPMPVLMIATVGASAFDAWDHRLAVPSVVGTALAATVLGITVAVHSPLNRQFLNWQPGNLPPMSTALLARWNRWDSVRVLVALAAFLSTILGAGG
jgi:hypothetical protein